MSSVRAGLLFERRSSIPQSCSPATHSSADRRSPGTAAASSYSGDAEVDGRYELFKAPIAGGPSIRLDAPLVPGGYVGTFLVTPDGQRAVYSADQETDDFFELYAAPLAGSGGTGPRACQ